MLKQYEQYDDCTIIDKIIAGETALYEILIRKYNPLLYSIGRIYRYNHHDTEDLMQETFISVFFNLSAFENRSSFKTWIVRIMLNHCYRKKQKFSFYREICTENNHSENSHPMFHHTPETDNIILTRELGHVMENALLKIPEAYKIVFSLRELNQLSVAETAEVLHISESNVKTRLNRAKTMLRSEIEKIYSPKDIFEFNLIYCDRIVSKTMRQINSIKNKHAGNE